MRKSNYVSQRLSYHTADVGVVPYLAHQFSLFVWLPLELWVIAMFPFIILDWRVERFVAKLLKRCIVLRWVNAMACSLRMVESLVALERILRQTAASRGVATHSIYKRANSNLP